MPIDTGLPDRFDRDFPRPGLPQGTQQFRENFRAIEGAIEAIHNMEATDASPFDVSASLGADGKLRVTIGMADNAFLLPQGDPLVDPRPGMLRYAGGMLEVFTGASWYGVGGHVAHHLAQPRAITLTGAVSGSIGFDGSQDVEINTGHTPSGVRAGIYGSQTHVPVIAVDEAGRIMSAETALVQMPRRIEHDQAIAQAVWQIDHGMDDFPSVTLVGRTGRALVGEISYPSRNQIVVRFEQPQAGIARLL